MDNLLKPRRSTRKALFMLFASGAMAGAAAGLLLSPRPGQHFRRQVANTARRAARGATRAFSGASSTVTNVVSRGRRAFVAGKLAYVNGRGTERPLVQGSTVKSPISAR